MEKVKHFSLFSGIESFKKALTNLGIENELVGYSEFDKYATTALAAIHEVSENLNYGDITKIDEKKSYRRRHVTNVFIHCSNI